MGRSIGAVIVGFIVWTIIWLGGNFAMVAGMPGQYDLETGFPTTTTPWVIALALSVICSGFAGLVAAKISRAASRDVLILAIILLLVGIAVQASAWAQIPLWYNLVFLALIVPITILGGRLGAAR